MNSDFVAEILRATENLRAGDPGGATAIIQAALAQGGLGSAGAARGGAAEPSGVAGWAAEPFIEGTLARAETSGPGEEAHAHTVRPQRQRRPLGEVIRSLRDGRRRLGADALHARRPMADPDLPLPDGAEFRDLTFACAAGSRRYRLYVPASASDGLEGLILMLHGCTQSPEDFAAGTRMNEMAESHRLLVVYPAQTAGENAMSCWNWFRPADQMRGAGEPAILAGLTLSVRDSFAVPRDRVFVAGLSAGGAMAATMAEIYPDLYAGAGIHSGLDYGSASDVASAFGAMRGLGLPGHQEGHRQGRAGSPRLIVFHGSADATVHPSNAERIAGRRGGARVSRSDLPGSGGRRGYTLTVAEGADGTVVLECWMIEGAPHAWSGGSARGSYTDPVGPDASRAMVQFFLHGSSGA